MPELLTRRIESGEDETVISEVPLISEALAPVKAERAFVPFTERAKEIAVKLCGSGSSPASESCVEDKAIHQLIKYVPGSVKVNVPVDGA